MATTPGESQDAGSASDRVADAIRTWMFNRGLEPGDRLGREEDLAERFGVSRPTLREALKLLSSAHLIRAVKGPGGGIFVASTGEDSIGRVISDSVGAMLLAESIDMHELLDTRILLEVPLAGLAALRASDSEVTECRALIDQADSAREDLDTLHRIDSELHALIVRVAGNRLAGALMQWVGAVAQAPLYRLLDEALVVPVVYDHLESIVRSVERGDTSGAERAMREHLVYIRDVLSAVRPRPAQ
jgi:GntR family transcriptional repressor for pyruvate dehydrogenase complex